MTSKIYEKKHSYKKGEKGKIPQPIKGHDERLKFPERQHFPFLSLKVDFLGLEITQFNGSVVALISNNGNAVATTPVIEVYESPFLSLKAPQADPLLYNRCGRLILPPLYPKQSNLGLIPCQPKKDSTLLIVICYDPILDIRPKLTAEELDRPEFYRKIGSGWFVRKV